jgi:hypothetical protein
MSSALDEFERSLVTASRALYAEHVAQIQLRATPAELPRPPRRLMRSAFHRRLLVLLAGLVIAAGGVAAASSLLFPSQRLADGTVNCFMATHGTGAPDVHTLAVGGARPNGNPPIELCRTWYRLNHYRLNGSTTGSLVASLPLIACRQNAITVAVYVATGRADQCQRLGERPLPATYAAAAARLRDLQAALLALQNEHDCSSVATLARAARAILANQGFAGWRVITPPRDPGKHWLFGYTVPAGTGGTCGEVVLGPPSRTLNIDTQRQTLTVSVGPPRSISLELNHVSYELYTTTYNRCFTATSVRALVRHWFASTPLRPRFATANTSDGAIYQPRSQHLYDQGCVRFDSAIAGDNSRFVDVLLNARGAAPLPAGQFYPPASSFHP